MLKSHGFELTGKVSSCKAFFGWLPKEGIEVVRGLPEIYYCHDDCPYLIQE